MENFFVVKFLNWLRFLMNLVGIDVLREDFKLTPQFFVAYGMVLAQPYISGLFIYHHLDNLVICTECLATLCKYKVYCVS